MKAAVIIGAALALLSVITVTAVQAQVFTHWNNHGWRSWNYTTGNVPYGIIQHNFTVPLPPGQYNHQFQGPHFQGPVLPTWR